MSKIGIMIPGISGTTASTLAAGIWLLHNSSNELAKIGLVTELSPARDLPLVSLSDIVVGGWDIRPCDPFETCRSNKVFSNCEILDALKNMPPPVTYSAFVAESDYVRLRENISLTNSSLTNALEQIQQDIESFRSSENVSDIIVINLSNPAKNPDSQEWPEDSEEFFRLISTNDRRITSGMLYCLAALKQGCAYIDFTPSNTLTIKALENEAIKNQVPIAGRDGSTGQTLIKSVLAHMFELRNLIIDGWYSTNLLGNHDGLVLSDPDFSKLKLHDKKQVLGAILPDPVEHLVDIRYLSTKKDCKEAWDSIEFRGWLNEPMSLKLNWLGRDSVLAVPLLIDLARLMAYCLASHKVGLQSQFAIFFKHPLGTEERRFFKLFQMFEQFCYQSIEEQKQ